MNKSIQNNPGPGNYSIPTFTDQLKAKVLKKTTTLKPLNSSNAKYLSNKEIQYEVTDSMENTS